MPNRSLSHEDIALHLPVHEIRFLVHGEKRDRSRVVDTVERLQAFAFRPRDFRDLRLVGVEGGDTAEAVRSASVI